MERHDHHQHSFCPESPPPTGAGDMNQPHQPHQQCIRYLQQPPSLPTGTLSASPSYRSRQKVSLEMGKGNKTLGSGEGGREGGREGRRKGMVRQTTGRQAGVYPLPKCLPPCGVRPLKAALCVYSSPFLPPSPFISPSSAVHTHAISDVATPAIRDLLLFLFEPLSDISSSSSAVPLIFLSLLLRLRRRPRDVCQWQQQQQQQQQEQWQQQQQEQWQQQQRQQQQRQQADGDPPGSSSGWGGRGRGEE